MKQAIGFIDSGLGGLTVMKEAMKALPRESMIFLGDTARCPYGEKSPQEILDYTWEMVNFLLEKEVKMIVIACNTATAIALEDIQAKVPVPVLGVIQAGAKAALEATGNKKIALLATRATIESGVYQQLIKSLDPQVEVTSLACGDFVTLVEEGKSQEADAWDRVHDHLQPISNATCDTVVMACTHFPMLEAAIQKALGPDKILIDAGKETVTALKVLLDYFQLRANPHDQEPTDYEFFVTGDPAPFASIAGKWLERDDLEVKKVALMPRTAKEILIVATKNQGKAREFAALFAPYGFEVKTLNDFPQLEQVEETGKTFEENARLKAEKLCQELGLPVLADDSGLCVDSLEGAPGIYSARYAGPGKSDAANNAKLLSQLGQVEGLDRAASFHCAIALAFPGSQSLVVHGICQGYIADYPQGEGGFGYDSLFYYPPLGKTFGQLSSKEKNQISHRALALQQLFDALPAWLGRGEEQV